MKDSNDRRFDVLAILCMVLLLSVAGTAFSGGQEEKAQAAKVTLRLGHVMGTDIARHRAAVMMQEYVAKESGGRINIELYPLGQLGEIRELVSGVQMGTIDMIIVGVEMDTVEPRVGVFELPYVFQDVDHMLRVLRSPVAEEIFASLEKNGIKVLAPTLSGVRYLTTSSKPVRTPADLQGLKIRVPNTKLHVATLEAMGSRPIPMSYNEVYLALQQGVVDGQENPTAQIDSAKFYEVQKYLSKTCHMIGPTFLVASKKKFDSLSKEDQALLLSGAKLWSDRNIEMLVSEDEKLLQKFQSSGVTILEPDRAAFQEATRKVIDKFPELKAAYESMLKIR